jgi:2-polyprenyl-3-methyl-5-hydroxy-6-metoxy-1,4-benzoquinol methylase
VIVIVTCINRDYDKLESFVSYYNQYNLIKSLNPKKILEIGVGNKTLSNYLKIQKFNIKTVDIDPKYKPDVVGDVRSLPFKSKSFDCVVAFEVLEHLPFNDFKLALKELSRVSNGNLIISLPYVSARFGGIIFLFRHKFNLSFKLTEYFWLAHKFKGAHYWEMGKRGYSLAKIRSEIQSCGLSIKQEYNSPYNPSHYFFVIKN